MDPLEHLTPLGSNISSIFAIGTNDLDRVTSCDVDVSLAVRGQISMQVTQSFSLWITGPPRNRLVDTIPLTGADGGRFVRRMKGQ